MIDSLEETPRARLSAAAAAKISGAFYALFCALYIWLSTNLVSRIAADTEEMRSLEITKGIFFILVTSFFIGGLVWMLLRRIEKQTDEAYAVRRALVIAERRALLGVFSAAIAHDMRNILLVIQSGMGLLESDNPAIRERGLQVTQDAIHSLTQLTHTLMDSASSGSMGPLDEVDADELVRKFLTVLHHHTGFRNCRFEQDLSLNGPLRVNQILVQQMLLNLLLNAADATGGQGRILLRVYEEDLSYIFEVHDNGPGVPEELRAKVFDPFFTTKTEGHGLGLLSVTACAEAHSGKAEILSSAQLGGACFRVILPKATETQCDDLDEPGQLTA